jgi:deoxyribonuclease-4
MKKLFTGGYAMLKIGCHLSASKGFLAMAKTADSIGANVFQFFTRNPRGGAAKAIDQADVDAFLQYAAERNMSHFLAHAPYTLNACAADPKILNFCRETMADDLQRMEFIPGSMYNFHPGSHVKQGPEKGVELIAETLNTVLFPEQTTTVLLETMAGKGSEMGGNFRELREIIDRTELSDKLGVCLDTCHVSDGGYDIINDLDGVLEEFDRIVGLHRLKAIHLNDSKNPPASHKDRHETIGNGYLGLETFRRVINHPALRELPFYLETPNELPGYAGEIKLLRDMYEE